MLRYGDIDQQEVMSVINNVIDSSNRHMRVYTALANAAGVTYNAVPLYSATYATNQFVNTILNRSGAAAVTDTTPTAAAIVAAFAGCIVGSTFEFTVLNNNTGILTIAPGTGVTTGGTMTVAAANGRRFIGQIVNPTAGSEAVFLQSIMSGAL